MKALAKLEPLSKLSLLLYGTMSLTIQQALVRQTFELLQERLALHSFQSISSQWT